MAGQPNAGSLSANSKRRGGRRRCGSGSGTARHYARSRRTSIVPRGCCSGGSTPSPNGSADTGRRSSRAPPRWSRRGKRCSTRLTSTARAQCKRRAFEPTTVGGTLALLIARRLARSSTRISGDIAHLHLEPGKPMATPARCRFRTLMPRCRNSRRGTTRRIRDRAHTTSASAHPFPEEAPPGGCRARPVVHPGPQRNPRPAQSGWARDWWARFTPGRDCRSRC